MSENMVSEEETRIMQPDDVRKVTSMRTMGVGVYIVTHSIITDHPILQPYLHIIRC
jgi:hypothetical protein